MSIGKSSINRVAEGLDAENSMPLNMVLSPEEKAEKPAEVPAAPAAEPTPKKKKAPARGKPAAAEKESAEKTPEQQAEDKRYAAEEQAGVAPELIGQSVAAPRKRGRKPGSKNKPKVAAERVEKEKKAPRKAEVEAIPAPAEQKKQNNGCISFTEELPVYLL